MTDNALDELDKWRRIARKHEERDRIHYRTLIAVKSQLEQALDRIDDDLDTTAAIRTRKPSQ